MIPSTNGAKRILVVEGDPDYSDLLASKLVGRGFQVDRAYDGRTALARVHEERPDLITLNTQMPQRTGIMFYREMKRSESLRSIPVIVITDFTHKDSDPRDSIPTSIEADQVPAPEACLDKSCYSGILARTVDAVLRTASMDRPEVA